MTTRSRRRPGSGLLAVALLLVAASTAEEDLTDWRSGPVRYLITGAETKQFKRLTTQEERARFVEQFWKRRDPTPETPENELKETFFRRVDEANRQFVETTKLGWKTDRGRIYILLGPPDEIESDPVQKEGRGEIRWIYRSGPTADSGPNRIIAFLEDRSGEFRLSTDPGRYGLMQSFVTRPSLVLPTTLVDSMPPPPGPTPAQIQLDIGRMLLPPGEEELLREVVTVETYPGLLPFLPRFDFYRSTDGLTFVAVNIGIERRILPAEVSPESLLPVARLDGLDGAGRTYDFVYRNPFSPAPDNDDGGYLVFQAGQGVVPGRYRAYLGVYDPERGELVSRHQDLTVPGFPPDRLSLSSLTLARQAVPASAEEAAGPFKRPYVLAGRRIVPRLEPSFRNGDTFSLYFQVYGAAADGSGRTPLNLRYRFLSLDGEQATPIGEPVHAGELAEQAVGWQFPLESWPMGRFRLEVTVTDVVAGSTAGGSIDFAVDG